MFRKKRMQTRTRLADNDFKKLLLDLFSYFHVNNVIGTRKQNLEEVFFVRSVFRNIYPRKLVSKKIYIMNK